MSTESPTSLNAQDFSGSDDKILDNFADGPLPDDADTHDDGTPMGLGGEKGKQSEPASSTLESDILNQPGEEPENTAPSEPVPDEGEPSPETIEPEPEEPDTPEFPPQLLQMAGLADSESAVAAGFQNPESLFTAIKWRGQLLAPDAKPKPSEQGLYRSRSEPPADEAKVETKGDVQPFQIPADKLENMDEDVQEVLRQMNEHYSPLNGMVASQQKELESLRAELKQRDDAIALQQGQDEEMQFDQAVQGLGDDWKEVFGEGSGRDLDRLGQSDPVAMTNFNHRRLLFDTVQAVREVNASQGGKPMPLEQELQWALFQRYPEKFQQTISGNSKGSRKGVTASRPTQRKTPPKSQNEKVLADIDAMLKKKGRPPLSRSPKEEGDGEI